MSSCLVEVFEASKDCLLMVSGLIGNTSELGRMAHAPESLHSEGDYCVHDTRSGQIVCYVIGSGSTAVTEWDSFFIASALNHALHNESHAVITSNPYRLKAWSTFFCDSVCGIDARVPVLAADGQSFGLGFQDCDFNINLRLGPGLAGGNFWVHLIHSAAKDFFELVTDHLAKRF